MTHYNVLSTRSFYPLYDTAVRCLVYQAFAFANRVFFVEMRLVWSGLREIRLPFMYTVRVHIDDNFVQCVHKKCPASFYAIIVSFLRHMSNMYHGVLEPFIR